MNRLIYLLVLFAFSFLGCREEKPKHNDFVGYWIGNSNDTIKINVDGTVIGKHLPFQLFMRMLHTPKDSTIKSFDGSGKWSFKEGEGFWKYQSWFITLDFDSISVTEYSAGLRTTMLVRGENSFWENKPPWFLFLWKGEEGGERYEFHKQK